LLHFSNVADVTLAFVSEILQIFSKYIRKYFWDVSLLFVLSFK
jgi:hypothetical protein